MVLTLKVVLEGIRPQVWRRLRVPATFSLADVHVVVQVAMGWEDSHLHQFTIDRVSYTAVTADDPSDMRDERSIRLSDLARKGRSFTYEYDFGDGWEHKITVEEIDKDATDSAATCVDGKRACPPEDSGGPYGYMRLARILGNPRHREYEDMRDWAGDFDPTTFDVTSINGRLLGRRVRRTRRSLGARVSG
jgi:hypothetical protein